MYESLLLGKIIKICQYYEFMLDRKINKRDVISIRGLNEMNIIIFKISKTNRTTTYVHNFIINLYFIFLNIRNRQFCSRTHFVRLDIRQPVLSTDKPSAPQPPSKLQTWKIVVPFWKKGKQIIPLIIIAFNGDIKNYVCETFLKFNLDLVYYNQMKLIYISNYRTWHLLH